MKTKRLTLLNPTGEGEIRPKDVWGEGKFLSRTVGSEKINRGIGLICIPGQPILAPMDGILFKLKTDLHNKDFKYSCLSIVNDVRKVVLKYVIINETLKNHNVLAGDTIGIAQDISGKYGYTIIPHVILELWIANDPTELLKNKEITYEIITDDR